jgi:hypothetical protein
MRIIEQFHAKHFFIFGTWHTRLGRAGLVMAGSSSLNVENKHLPTRYYVKLVQRQRNGGGVLPGSWRTGRVIYDAMP